MKKSIKNINLLASSICNLNCEYCYVPKSEMLKCVHDKMNDNIKDGSIFKYLQDNYILNEVESIGFWGAEPTLNLDNCFIFLSNMLSVAKISEIIIPTNLTTNQKNLFSFIKKINPPDKNMKVSIQVSLDGPSFITDKNRGEGTTDKIINNLYRFIDHYNHPKNIDLNNINIHVFGKLTWSSSTLDYICTNPDVIVDIDLFLKDLTYNLRNKNINKNVTIGEFSTGNMAIPGNYTTNDGILLRKVFDICAQKEHTEFGPLLFYFNSFKKIIENKTIFSKPQFITCGSSKCSASIGENCTSNLCHRSFHMGYDNTEKDWYQNLFVYTDNLEKMEYTLQSYHYFSSITLNLTANIILELAKNKQVLEKYKDMHNAFLLSLFINQSINCPMENLLENCNMYCNPVSSIRLLGNGVLDFLIDLYHRRKEC